MAIWPTTSALRIRAAGAPRRPRPAAFNRSTTSVRVDWNAGPSATRSPAAVDTSIANANTRPLT